MSIRTRLHEISYEGSDEETTASLVELFPEFQCAKNCVCIDKGVIVRNQDNIINDTFSVPSTTIICANCQTLYGLSLSSP